MKKYMSQQSTKFLWLQILTTKAQRQKHFAVFSTTNAYALYLNFIVNTQKCGLVFWLMDAFAHKARPPAQTRAFLFFIA